LPYSALLKAKSMLHDPALLKLGRKPARHDARTLRLGAYLTPGELPEAPASYDSGTKVSDWGMFANDQLGDCTCAGILHMIMLWDSQDSPTPKFSDADAIALYSQLCGYVPGEPATDQGGIELDILTSWRKQPILGHSLQAYVAVNPKNWAHVKLAHWLFGSLYLGVSLPTSAQTEEVWADTSGIPGSWGGHCVVSSGYADRQHCFDKDTLTVITWGEEKKMTRQWLAKYCDELYAPLSPTWLGSAGKAPNGFDADQLMADLTSI
jgi:hypothetical protein